MYRITLVHVKEYDSERTLRLFSAHVVLQFLLGCGGTVQLSASRPTALITSPNYPNNYPQNVDCTWTVTAPTNRKVQFQFIGDIFSIESHTT